MSFIKEAIATAEIGWRTHERSIPVDLLSHDETNRPCNLVCLIHNDMNASVNIHFFFCALFIEKNNLWIRLQVSNRKMINYRSSNSSLCMLFNRVSYI